MYDEDALAPGYWFVSPYEKNGYKQPGGSWIGPHIYDGSGELIWSGSHLFNHINVMDFGVMKVGNEDLLSMSYAVEGKGKRKRGLEPLISDMLIPSGFTSRIHSGHAV